MLLDIIFEILRYTDIETSYKLISNYPSIRKINPLYYYTIFINKYCKKIKFSLNLKVFNINQLENIYDSLYDLNINLSNNKCKTKMLEYLCKIEDESILFRILLSKMLKDNILTNTNYLINECIKNNNFNKLKIINEKKKHSNLLINKTSICNLMKNKQYKMIKLIFHLYLGEQINLRIYFNQIYNNFDYNNNECLSLCKKLSLENNNIIFKNKHGYDS